MSRHFCWTLLLLSACSTSATAPTDPTAPKDPPPPTTPTPINVAGEWIDTTTFPGQPTVWHITQHGAVVSVTDTAYDRDDSVYIVLGTGQDSARVAGDTLYFSSCTDCYAPIAVASSDTISFVGAAGVFVRGSWAPPAAASTPGLNGVYQSDSLPWTALGQSCQGTVQIELVIDSIPGSGGGYQSTEYDRQCGSTWQAAIGQWVVIDTGHAVDGVLALAEQQLPGGYTGPFTAQGNNWRFAIASSDSLADITPTSINLGWLPPAFVFQPAGFYARANRAAPAIPNRRRS